MSAPLFLAVGDRVRNTLAPQWGTVVVTELTVAGGFKYRHDEPHSLGPRHGTVLDGEVYVTGLDSWVRVTESQIASSPATKGAAIHQLRLNADAMERAAQDSRKLADVLAAMPDPIGYFVIELARALAPHGLAVVSTSAVELAITTLETFQPDEGEEFPEEAVAYAQRAITSLKTSLKP